MNLRSKLMGTLGALAAAAALGATPIIASASSVYEGAVVFTGATTSLSCTPLVVTIPGVGCPSGGGNFVPLVGGTGNFTFSTALFNGLAGGCFPVAAEEETPNDTDPATQVGPLPLWVEESAGTCTISSSGSYINIVCGTGAVLPFATATVNDSSGDSLNVSYAIAFVAGVGILAGTATVTDGSTGNTSSAGAAVGVVDISPPAAAPPPAPACVTSFNVVGISAFGAEGA